MSSKLVTMCDASTSSSVILLPEINIGQDMAHWNFDLKGPWRVLTRK